MAATICSGSLHANTTWTFPKSHKALSKNVTSKTNSALQKVPLDGEVQIGSAIITPLAALRSSIPEQLPGTVLVVRFQFDSVQLTPESVEGLDALADQLIQQGWSGQRISLHGHTDNIGTIENNYMLSQRRANEVMMYLQKRTGASSERFEVIGHGELDPITGNVSGQARSINRRVEVRIAL